MDITADSVGDIIGVIILIAVSVWVFLDAKAIGDDRGRTPGVVNTRAGFWAGGVFLALIVVLPFYLLMRFHYNRLLAERRAARAAFPPDDAGILDPTSVWPPPPTTPRA